MRRWLFARSLAPLLLFAGAASAQPENANALAEALFREANTLVEQGKVAEACPKFLASHRADPSYGAVLNLGECYKQLGKTASAWSAFLEAAGLAQKLGETARFNDANGRAKAMEPKLVRLVIVVKGSGAAVSVRRDEQEVEPVVLGVAVPVDPGEHSIVASAPGKKEYSTRAKASGEGQTVTVEIPPLEDAAPAGSSSSAVPSPGAAPSARPDGSLGAQRSVAIAAAALGLAGVGAGAGLGVAAQSRWSSVSAQCDPAGHCTSRAAVDAGNEARSLAHGSTAAFAVGGAAVVGAVVLWLTAPKAAPAKTGASLSGFATPEGAGLVLQGRF